MSDGNFNTKLLPAGGFSGGVRTGEARMRQRALQAFSKIVSDHLSVSIEEGERLQKEFRALLLAQHS